MFWFGFSFNLKTNFLYQKNAFCHFTGHSILICFQLSSFKIICKQCEALKSLSNKRSLGNNEVSLPFKKIDA